MPDTHDHPRFVRVHTTRLTLAAAALVALGGEAGAVAMHAACPTVSMAPATPVAIHTLSSSEFVTVKGRVAEIYGNKFIMADASGRALIDTGREGEGGGLVTPGEDVIIQGRFARGFVQAAYLVGPDAKVVALGLLDGPPRPGGPGRHGPRPGLADGPGAPPPPGAGPLSDVGAPPPPPAGADGTVPPPPPPVGAANIASPGTSPATPAPTRN